MLKKLVLCLLCFVINLHIAGSVAAPSKSSKLATQETSKESKTETEKTSEEKTEESDTLSELVLINHFLGNSSFFIPTEYKTDFHDYISHYKSPPKKVPVVPPSLI